MSQREKKYPTDIKKDFFFFRNSDGRNINMIFKSNLLRRDEKGYFSTQREKKEMNCAIKSEGKKRE